MFLSSLYLLFKMCDGLGGGLRSLSALLVVLCDWSVLVTLGPSWLERNAAIEIFVFKILYDDSHTIQKEVFLGNLQYVSDNNATFHEYPSYGLPGVMANTVTSPQPD